MIEYQEHAPPARLARYVECFWHIRTSARGAVHHVLPDGCADIIFSQNGSQADLNVVGTMTFARSFPLAGNQDLFGVRFRPGMWNLFLRVPWGELTDRTAGLEDLLGTSGKSLMQKLGGISSIREIAAAMDEWLGVPDEESIVQKTAGYIAARYGNLRVEQLAAQSGRSARQLSRLFVAQIGVSPKQLCRILRFRRSIQRLRRTTDCAQLALECGYYDQAHWINEFRDLSGYSPGEYRLRNESSPA